MWQTWRCNHCGGHDKHAFLKRKKRSFEQVLESVRTILLSDYRPVKDDEGHIEWMDVRKESLALQLEVDTSLVERALQILNREGIVSQPRHIIPHDCKRDRTPLAWGHDSSWIADRYTVCGSYWIKALNIVKEES